MQGPGLFDAENALLDSAKSAYASPIDDGGHRRMLGELIVHYERLMRETRRLILRSDRAESVMQKLNRQLHELTGQLEYRATHDSLTGALNRSAVVTRAARYLECGAMAMIVIDIDHFKHVNDDFGHPAGDAVIEAVAASLVLLVGADGVVGRIGGEEFSVLLPRQSAQAAFSLAQQLRAAIARHDFAAPVNRQVTASFGVSWNPAGSSFESAYGRADAALYEAKRSGRNCVVAAAD
ncbi:GGDEF domain-containing protein [Massilia sp. PWRC2]|uniref:GGDEF domain-containing protein n=1 Tax=Massilia sp. PWRC2 TaxID=2804626 RepID=UPI003CE68E3C